MTRPLGIMSAMGEEADSVVAAMRVRRVDESGSRRYHVGELEGREVVVTFSHWGKVAAASTATWLIACHGVDEIVFTGVAGALDPALRIGDVVVASELWQHDMDASPMLPRHVIPLIGRAALETDAAATARLERAAREFVRHRLREQVGAATIEAFALRDPRVVVAPIATGDRFVSSDAEVAELRARLPNVACVEMEGAAVAQVCHAHGLPFSIVRTISDAADEAATNDFPRFVNEVARSYSLEMVRALLAPGRAARGDQPASTE